MKLKEVIAPSSLRKFFASKASHWAERTDDSIECTLQTSVRSAEGHSACKELGIFTDNKMALPPKRKCQVSQNISEVSLFAINKDTIVIPRHSL